MLTDETLIIKHNELVEARYKLSLGEQRLILLLASTIQQGDKDFNTYDIRVADFAEMFGLKTDKSLYEKVEEAAKELLGKQLFLKNNNEDFEATVWLSYVKYTRGSGVVRLRFDESLKPYLLQLNKQFTKYKLTQVMSFKSSYSIRLYELLKKEAYKAKNRQFERCFSLEEYRIYLGIEEKKYSVFADFRKWVIEPAVREISDFTDLNIFETKYTKTGRKITGLCFVVLVRDKEEAQARLENMRIEDVPKTKPDIHPIIEKLALYGFTHENAKTLKNKYGIKRIERNLAYMLAEEKAGKEIKNKGGYLVKAFEEDWGNALEIMEQKKKEAEAKKQAEEQKQRLQEQEEKRQAEAQKQQNIAAVEAFLNLPSGLKAIIKQGFEETKPMKNNFTRERWRKVQESKDDSMIKNEPLIRGEFARYLLENNFI